MSKKETLINIEELSTVDVSVYCALIREVYNEFVAPDYPEEGNLHFYTFITKDAVLERICKGNLTLCAKINGEMAGVCAFRDGTHMSTLFVRKKYHRRGVAGALLRKALEMLAEQYPDADRLTVNSSPYARGIYKKLGFVPTAERQQKDGIIFYPMEYKLVIKKAAGK